MFSSDIEKLLEEKESELAIARSKADSLAKDSAEGAGARKKADALLIEVLHLQSKLKHAK